jgi:hypothetical protein
MSQSLFQARFDITNVTPVTSVLWEVTGRVIDTSYNNFGPSNVIVGDVFFDESLTDSVINRYRIVDVISMGIPTPTSIVVRCVYDETGTPAGTAGQPVPCSGAICRLTETHLSMNPSIGWAHLSETLQFAIINLNNQLISKDSKGVIQLFPTVDFFSSPYAINIIQMTPLGMTKVMIGLPLKFVFAGNPFFAVIKDTDTINNRITIRGAALPMGNSIDSMEIATVENLMKLDVFVKDAYALTLSTTLYADLMKSHIRFVDMPTIYLVSIAAIQNTESADPQPIVNILNEGNRVCTDNATKGILMGTSGTWVDSGDVSINVSNYNFTYGNMLEVECSQVQGGLPNATDLTFYLTFVVEW